MCHHIRKERFFIQNCILGALLCVALSGCATHDVHTSTAEEPFITTGKQKTEKQETKKAVIQEVIHPEASELYSLALNMWFEDHYEDPEQAIALLNSALALEPNFAVALGQRGLAFQQLTLFADAFADFTAAIRLQPSAEWYARRAGLLIREGNPLGAERDLETAFQNDQENGTAYMYRGVLQLMKHDHEAACRDFSAAARFGQPRLFEKAQADGLCP